MDTKKAVYTIVERPENESGKKNFWVRIGAAFLNRDGSYTVKLDAFPVNGVLQLRDWPVPREDWRNRENGTQPGVNGTAAGGHSHADIFAGG